MSYKLLASVLAVGIILSLGIWWNSSGTVEKTWLTNIFPEGDDDDIVATGVEFSQGSDTLTASLCIRDTESGNLSLEDVFVSFKDKEGKHYTLISETGKQDAATGVVTFEGTVVLTSDEGQKVFTDRLIYRRKEGVVRSPGKVKIVEKGSVTTGDELFMDLKKDMTKIRGNVRVLLERTSSGSQEGKP